MVQQNAHYIQNCSQLPEGRTELQLTGICVLQTRLLSSRQSGPARIFSTGFPTLVSILHFSLHSKTLSDLFSLRKQHPGSC